MLYYNRGQNEARQKILKKLNQRSSRRGNEREIFLKEPFGLGAMGALGAKVSDLNVGEAEKMAAYVRRG